MEVLFCCTLGDPLVFIPMRFPRYHVMESAYRLSVASTKRIFRQWKEKELTNVDGSSSTHPSTPVFVTVLQAL